MNEYEPIATKFYVRKLLRNI